MSASRSSMGSRPIVMAAALLAAGLAAGALAQQSDQTSVAVAQTEKFGAHLTDGSGRPLYLFTADQQGKGQNKAQSTCYDACARAWPPLLRSGATPVAGDKADAALLGTIARKDGGQQITYNGWPLYYFVKDQGNRVSGQDVHGFGGEWYLVKPDGSKLESEG